MKNKVAQAQIIISSKNVFKSFYLFIMVAKKSFIMWHVRIIETSHSILWIYIFNFPVMTFKFTKLFGLLVLDVTMVMIKSKQHELTIRFRFLFHFGFIYHFKIWQIEWNLENQFLWRFFHIIYYQSMYRFYSESLQNEG